MLGLLPPQIISPSFNLSWGKLFSYQLWFCCYLAFFSLSLCASAFPVAELSDFSQPSLPLKPLPTFPFIYTLPSCRNQMLPLYTDSGTHTHTHTWPSGSLCNSVPQFFLIQSGQWSIQCQTLDAFCGGGWDGGSGLTGETRLGEQRAENSTFM